jgi:hypothetical protein
MLEENDAARTAAPERGGAGARRSERAAYRRAETAPAHPHDGRVSDECVARSRRDGASERAPGSFVVNTMFAAFFSDDTCKK